MRFRVKPGAPLVKAGETDEAGQPVPWASPGEELEIPVDSQDPEERRQAQAWLRGQSTRIELVEAKPAAGEAPVTRDMRGGVSEKSGARKKAAKKTKG